ncbi:MAG: response regulator [Proteobacteria bacterium]|nr:response regulator [Pseudomonadota bacterium]
MKLVESTELRVTDLQGRTVFVVDDNTVVRQMVCTVLENNGLQVVHADGPISALKLVEQLKTAPELMICDICMPVMSGPELYRLVEQRFPAQPVLFITGYPGEYLGRSGTVVTEERLLRKPFRVAELVERVEMMLG